MSINLFSFMLSEYKSQLFRLIRHTPVICDKIKLNKYGQKIIMDIDTGRDVLKQAIIDGKPFMAA